MNLLGNKTLRSNSQRKKEKENKRDENWDLKGPNVRVIKGKENLFNLEETALVVSEIDGIAALEIDLDEDQALVVLAENRLEETASAENLLKDQIVGGRQVVEVVLGGGDLGGARDLVAHSVPLRRARLFSFFCGCVLSNHLCVCEGRGTTEAFLLAVIDSETYLRVEFPVSTFEQRSSIC